MPSYYDKNAGSSPMMSSAAVVRGLVGGTLLCGVAVGLSFCVARFPAVNPWVADRVVWAMLYVVLGVLAVGMWLLLRVARFAPALLARGIAVVLLCAALLTATGLLFGWGRGVVRQYAAARKTICMRRLKEIGDALQGFAAANHGRLPEAGEWCDALAPYVSDEEAFVCPCAANSECAYAFNSRLSGMEVEAAGKAVVVFESDAGWNAAGGPELLPASPRWHGGDQYCLAYGHVTWCHRKRDSIIWEPVLKEQAGEADKPSP